METELNYECLSNEHIFTGNNTTVDWSLLEELLGNSFQMVEAVDASVYYDQVVTHKKSAAPTEEWTVVWENDLEHKYIYPFLNEDGDTYITMQSSNPWFMRKRKYEDLDDRVLEGSDDLDEHLKQFTVRR